ncbi:hypothetical protein B0H15DRAFT_1022402 [Mycena belliarum]|uniref:Steroid 5-alpha reductase C-terminal domain-containing protein n=1 Tax=Mycena belliarum TaxID=1033014 RepID=A0AAD6U7U6_9AGAR|nr:hypothetical protein B0H15DRAFT_1022402 [Mycena belliae]
MAELSRLIPATASAFAWQTLLAIIFVPLQNEKYYDLGGAAGFVSTSVLALYYDSLKRKLIDGVPGPLPALSSFAPRQLLLTAAVALWAARIGTFLALRTHRTNGDKRFDNVRNNPKVFTIFWMIQGVWVWLCGLPIYAVNSLPPQNQPVLGPGDYAALALFAVSFLTEAVADAQKAAWRSAKDAKRHNEKFITGGLWSLSRHPNYVGEVGVWTALWALASGGLLTPSFPIEIAFTALSPLFSWLLVRMLSGVPFLEQVGDKHFEGDKKWEAYKETTPIFWPWGGKEDTRGGALSLF